MILVEEIKEELSIVKNKTEIKGYLKFNKPILFINSNDHNEIDKQIVASTKCFNKAKITEYREIGEVDFIDKSTKGYFNDLLSFLESIEVEAISNTVVLILRNVDEQLTNKQVLSKLQQISEKSNYKNSFNFYTVIISNHNLESKELDYLTTVVDIIKPSLNEIKKYIIDFFGKYSIQHNSEQEIR